MGLISKVHFDGIAHSLDIKMLTFPPSSQNVYAYGWISCLTYVYTLDKRDIHGNQSAPYDLTALTVAQVEALFAHVRDAAHAYLAATAS